MSINLADSISAIPCDAVAKSLFSITHSDDTLGITVPGEIVDSTIDNAVVAFCNSFADTVPNLDKTGRITTCDIEPRRRKAGDCSLGFVFGVLSSDRGVVDGTDEDGFVRL